MNNDLDEDLQAILQAVKNLTTPTNPAPVERIRWKTNQILSLGNDYSSHSNIWISDRLVHLVNLGLIDLHTSYRPKAVLVSYSVKDEDTCPFQDICATTTFWKDERRVMINTVCNTSKHKECTHYVSLSANPAWVEDSRLAMKSDDVDR